MKKTVIPIWIVFALLTSCDGPWVYETGNGVMVNETRTVGDFEYIEVNGAYQILLRQGDPSSIFIKADENLIDMINTERVGQTLKISNEESIRSDEGIEIVITFQQLEGITSSGAAMIENQGVIQGELLEVDLRGTGAINLQLEVEELDVDLSGAGIIELEGEAEVLRVQLKGAGNLSAYDFETRESEIRLSGVGAAQVYATKRLDAKVQGIGHISYRGNPEEIDQKVSGLGKIEEDRDYQGY